jgi:hypothetical protein
MNSGTLNCLWMLVFPIGTIEISTSRKCWFWLYFSYLHDCWPPSTWNSLVHTSWSKWNDVKNVFFRSSKCEKNSWNKKPKCVKDFLLSDMSSSIKDYTCNYVVSTWKTNIYINFDKNNENLKIICLEITGYLNTRKSFPICMFVVMAPGKCDLHIHFTFLQEL